MFRFPINAARAALVGGTVLLAAATASAQEAPMADQAIQQRVETIARERPPQAEAAARAFVFNIAPHRTGNGEGPLGVPVLDQLKAANLDAYWREVAQLTMQFEVFQRVLTRDTSRARLMSQLFMTEFEARGIQRAWRQASEAQRATLRPQLENLMNGHFDLEQALRAKEIQDVQQRLVAIQQEMERRRQRKAETVRWSVDDIIHSAQRPEDQ